MLTKSPAEVLDYTVTFSGDGWGTDTIASQTVTTNDVAMTVSRIANNGQASVSYWLAEGTPGFTATIVITVITTGGRTYESIQQVFVEPQ